MPITKGAGNPDWTWDETLLALDLLYRHGAPIDRHHSDVRDLSNALRAAEIHPKDKRKDNFRNPDGVALKLQNLQSAIDPARSLSSSKRDREVVAEFPLSRKHELAVIAVAILRELSIEPQPIEVPEDEIFIEGHVITASHRSRDRRLRRRLLDKCGDERLVCEVCDFSPPPLTRPLRESFFEAHHSVPLADAAGQTSTRVGDMVLLCAGCHRFIHKLISWRKRWIGVHEARSLLKLTDHDLELASPSRQLARGTHD
ncbi:5-methylcytosine-specific restriction protein A [Sinorhizobium americanum]|uniref:5-methylcytosine-specific restriction protein A n=1 Tax=Sinorhizobium americanum TaxID=194963 RepID=A0A4R2BX36_9HYPH|nr:5-methylcytosine-specific restriction protein A [Sinorhizobium americanum]